MGLLEVLGGIGGALISSSSNKKNAERQMAMQEHLAKNQVRFRVEDAKNAGVGTLAALGMQPISYSPVQVGGTDWGKHGANIGRAAEAMMSTPQRAMHHEMQAAQVENMNLQNEVLRNQVIASNIQLQNQAGVAPAVPGTRGREERGEDRPGELTTFGKNFNTHPGFSDAQKWEDRYGESVSDWVAGPFNIPADIFWQIQRGIERKFDRMNQRGRDRRASDYQRHGGVGGW